MPKTLVLLDSNALFMPFQFGINIEKELERLLGGCEIMVPSAVVDEVMRLGKRRHSRSALKLSSKYKSVKCDASPSVDAGIQRLAKKTGAVVVTNDRELQKKIVSDGGRVVSLRGGNHLVLLPSHRAS
jgi:hypothetical protein